MRLGERNLKMKPRIKICCISSIKEAMIAIECGASAIGLVGRMPSGPGVITDERIRQIARSVSPPIDTFLLTSETTAEGIIAHHKRTETNTIQIVDRIKIDQYRTIRESLSAIKLVQVIHVIDNNSVDQAISVSGHVDALLLDSGNPDLSIKKLGGTGRTHNWQLSRQIRDAVPIPVFLAGGLNPGNVRQAIDTVQPYAVDICNGVRTKGHLDVQKLEDFIGNVLS